MSEELEMYEMIARPVCSVCEQNIDVVSEENGVVMRCRCKDRFFLVRQYRFIESLPDEVYRSLYLNFMSGVSAMFEEQLLYQLLELRKRLGDEDVSVVDKKKFILQMRELNVTR